MLSIALLESYLDNSAAIGDYETPVRLASRLYLLALRVTRTREQDYDTRGRDIDLLDHLARAARSRANGIALRLAGHLRGARAAESDSDDAIRGAVSLVAERMQAGQRRIFQRCALETDTRCDPCPDFLVGCEGRIALSRRLITHNPKPTTGS
ncbi:hypothetical protein LCGC14_2287700 [marine sediment metagenome]|uniref:Uncharacterized protein n=1 Tax=marine sediment metagenome TaxID=412755 RepID=A0A0F9FMC7_9ZZZZ